MATKKITELPLIQTISGSYSVVPIVIGNVVGSGTTDQISIENFSRFVTAYSAHTGSAGNTFTGPQTINNNVTINGKLTVTELVATYETASVIYSEGGNIFGNELTDKQELTGSVNITGSLIYNNVLVTNIDANTINRLQQTTASLNTFTSSQADRNLVLSIVTGSINQATASIQFQTASLLAFTASQDSRNFTLSQVTGSFNYFYQATASLENFTSSQADRNLVLSIVTGSINQATASLQFHSASVEAQLARIQQATASLELASASFNYFYQSTASLQTFTASQADRNLVLSIVTGSINQATASIQAQTASLLAFTASQDSRNLTLSTVTGSLIGITNGLMAFTAALDNTYATDAQLYQLYQATASLQTFTSSQADRNLVLSTVTGSINQATASLQFQTASLLQFTASQDSRNFTLSQVTGSFRGEIGGLEEYTASLKTAAIVSSSTQVQNYDLFALNSNLYTSTGSLIGITNGLMAFTAALDNTYATDAQLYQLYQATQSLELHSGSMIGITNELMSYTASLKGAAIVSSSQQVQNYFAFALTSSNNSFFGESTFTNKVTHTNGYVVLSQVSASLNFVDDTAAAAGGVPLGGLYRNGNFIVIRIV
jgi:uncharacterized protein YqjF (DUF2071 family)